MFEKELEIFKEIKSTFILDGNIYDLYKFNHVFIKLDQYLYNFLKSNGYDRIVFYNPVSGFYNKFEDIKEFLNQYKKESNKIENEQKDDFLIASEIIKKMITESKEKVAVINEYSSRFIAAPNILEKNERNAFLNFLDASLNAKRNKDEQTNRLKRNLLFFITDKINNLPVWLYLNNPHVKMITISSPDNELKREFIKYREDEFYGYNESSKEEKKEFINKIITATGDLKTVELDSIKNLCLGEKIPIKRIKEAITLYKYGVKETPWENLDKDSLINCEEIIEKRVKGQSEAIEKTAMVIRRAMVGLSGMQHSSNSTPKGILFFAGPTGVGKTELAKSIAELIFGDEDSVIRFDMSEYFDEASAQRLFGAPPGYVGYEEGGQLTNAMKKRPFSVLLFDEIEKAHPSILDKFLQILEDGRMTDGQGTTVYFTETLIIFTSNLGVVGKDRNGEKIHFVTKDMESKKVKEIITKKVEEYFVEELKRPELLGRIGKNNIIVFDFINEKIANEILDKQINQIKQNLKKSGKIKDLIIEQNVYEFLKNKSIINLDEGGRGIGNQVEKYLINPLADFMFYNNVNEKEVCIKQIIEEKYKVKIECEVK